jgi:hypothetical protein
MSTFSKSMNLLLESGRILAISLLDVPSDGACFFHCISAFFEERRRNSHRCLEDLTDLEDLRSKLCNKLLESRNVTVPGLGLTPEEFFNTEYAPTSRNRQSLHNHVVNAKAISLGIDPAKFPNFADTFEFYIEMMRRPNTYADNLIVAFFAQQFNVNLSIFTRSITEVQQKLTGNEKVDTLISMGFRRDIIEQVLCETNGNLEQSIQKLLDHPSAEFVPNGSQSEIWREQPYNPSSELKIQMINDGNHFQLIIQKPRIRLPEIDLSILEDDSPIHHEPPSFGHTQLRSSSYCISNAQQFFDACNLAITSQQLPQHTEVRCRFNDVYLQYFRDNLFGSLIFVEHNMVRYSVVSFQMEDGSRVSYHGCIQNLSRSDEKNAFYSQLEPLISKQDVVSVTIAKL